MREHIVFKNNIYLKPACEYNKFIKSNNKYFQLIFKGKSKMGFLALKNDFPFSLL